MKKLVWVLIFLSTSLAFGQGFIAGGYGYNAREDDHAVWAEVGADIHKAGLAVDLTKWVSDPFKFREVALLARFKVLPNISAEAGYGIGAACFDPTRAHSCEFHGTARTRTPIVGVQWLSPKILLGMQPLVRMDFVRWQLPPTHGKDDGFRLLVGMRWPKAK